MPSTSLPSVIRHLTSIPTELVCEILDDLRYWDMLRLASQNEAKVNDAILCHITCGRIFDHEMSNLAETIEVFWLYSGLCRIMRVRKLPPTSRFALNISQDSDDGEYIYGYKTMIHDLHSLIMELLGRITFWQNAVLAPYAPQSSKYRHLSGISTYTIHGLEGLKDYLFQIRIAQRELNTKKAFQLRRAADLLEANPDILKLTMDPEQKRRASLPHVVSQMRRAAEEISKSSVLNRSKYAGWHYFKYAYFPVAPFDDALTTLFERLAVCKKNGTSIPGPAEAMDIKKLSHVDHIVDWKYWKELNALFKDLGLSQGTHISTESDFSSSPNAHTGNESSSTTGHGVDQEIRSMTYRFFLGFSEIYTRRGLLQFYESKAGQPLHHHHPPVPDMVQRVTVKKRDLVYKGAISNNVRHCFAGLQYVRGHPKMWSIPSDARSMRYTAWLPHDEEEVEWLEAFVQVYRHFERKEHDSR